MGGYTPAGFFEGVATGLGSAATGWGLAFADDAAAAAFTLGADAFALDDASPFMKNDSMPPFGMLIGFRLCLWS